MLKSFALQAAKLEPATSLCSKVTFVPSRGLFARHVTHSCTMPLVREELRCSVGCAVGADGVLPTCAQIEARNFGYWMVQLRHAWWTNGGRLWICAKSHGVLRVGHSKHVSADSVRGKIGYFVVFPLRHSSLMPTPSLFPHVSLQQPCLHWMHNGMFVCIATLGKRLCTILPGHAMCTILPDWFSTCPRQRRDERKPLWTCRASSRRTNAHVSFSSEVSVE